MGDEEENLVPMFEALLTSLEEQLSPEQIWELDVHLRYDEVEEAFEGLCSMLRAHGSPLPRQARPLFRFLGVRLEIEEARWRDLAEANTQ
jgi:hypothetical protein